MESFALVNYDGASTSYMVIDDIHLSYSDGLQYNIGTDAPFGELTVEASPATRSLSLPET